MSDVLGQVSGIWIYPIKSLAGISLQSSALTAFGFKGDRLMMLVDKNNNFISQRLIPSLSLIEVSGDYHALTLRSGKHGTLTIEQDDFLSDSINATVWRQNCRGFVAKAHINQWFSQYCEREVHLIRYDVSCPRAADIEYSHEGDVVSFADSMPLLLTTTASLADLNQRLVRPVPIEVFRPNILIENKIPYAEDAYHHIQIGEAQLEASKPCSRCIMTTVMPETGEKDPRREPLATLSKYRKQDTGVIFGRLCIPRQYADIHISDTISRSE